MGTSLLVRLFLAGLGVIAFVLFTSARPIPEDTRSLVYLLLAATALLNLPFLLLPKTLRHPRLLYHLQAVVDVVAVSALVYLTGGAGSIFVPFYVAAILAACFQISPSAGFVYASAATIALSAITVLYHLYATSVLGHLPFLKLPTVRFFSGQSGQASYGYLALQVVSFFTVAILGGRLAAGLYRVRVLNEVVLENLSEGVLVVDPKGRILFANPEAQRLLGLPASETMVGKEVFACLQPEEALDLQEVMAGRGPRRREVLRGTEESRLFCQTISRPLLDQRRQLFGVLLVLSDLTLRKQKEEEVRKADRVESLEELAAGIAHEVRTPLTSIRGCAQELEQSFQAQGRDARLLSLLVREADRLNKIVGGVLDFARPLTARPVACRLDDVLSDVRQVLSRLNAGGHVLELRGSRGLTAWADPDLLKQVFLNIGANALQAMDDRPGRLTIQAREGFLGFGARAVWIDFEDEGKGISPEDFPNLFKPFFTTRADGTGLGLAVAQRIAQAHGGEIRVRSEPGAGAVFSVGLPQGPAPGRAEADSNRILSSTR